MHPPADEIDKACLDQPTNEYEQSADSNDDVIAESRDALLNCQYLCQDERDHKDDADDIDRQLLGGKQDDCKHEKQESDYDG